MTFEIQQRMFPTAGPWLFTGTDYPTLDDALEAGRAAQRLEPHLEFRVKGPDNREVHFEDATLEGLLACDCCGDEIEATEPTAPTCAECADACLDLSVA